MDDALPSLTGLRAFAAVARHGSVSRAATTLGVSQPAVTQQLRRLEAFLGLRLVRPAGAGIALTEAGALYALQINEAFDKIVQATHGLRAGAPSGKVVTVSLLATFAQRWLIPRLPGFQQRHPEVSVRLLATPEIMTRPSAEADFSICSEGGPWPGYRCDDLMPSSLFPVASPSLLARQPLRKAADLRAHVLIEVATAPRDGDWGQWLAAAGAAELKPQGRLSFTTSSQALEAALAGLGVAVTHGPFVADALAAGLLVAPLGPRIEEPGGYRLVAGGPRADGQAQRAFHHWLLESAGQQV